MPQNNTSRNPLVGMTEAGDAGRDLSWYDKLIANPRFAGAILITKYGQDASFQAKAKELFSQKPCIIHFGCTGWGGSPMEPGNVSPEEYINSIRTFIDSGFPATNVVLRIDPIIPTPEGLERAKNVVSLAKNIIPDVKRIRISIYDDYHAARQEMSRRGYAPIDHNTKWKNEMERRPTPEQVSRVAGALLSIAKPDQTFELCAEPELSQFMPDTLKWFGCLSQLDCDIMGITVPEEIGINGQSRYGCRCLMMKTELLSNKRRCPNNCAYCYWGRN